MPSLAPQPAASVDPAKPDGLRRLAHDLGNALASATARASVLANRDLPPAILEDLRSMLADIGRAREMLRELLQITTDSGGVADLFALWSRVSDALSKNGISTTLDAAVTSATVSANPVQIEQLLASVVAAEIAGHREKEGASIHVQIASDRDRVLLSIRSSSAPLTAEERDRSFHPFFLRNSDQLGEGLSFAVCSRIAQAHGGSFAIGTAAGGREYRLELPGIAEPLAPPAPETRIAPASNLRVLVVDDDPRVRESCALMLRHLGHTVSVAGGGTEALERLRAESFDAVLLDLNLGTRIDGKDVLLELEREWPEMLSSTFLSTGDPTSATVRELTRRLAVRVLAKPFGVEELREMLLALARET